MKNRKINQIRHFPTHNYPKWAWLLKNLKVSDDQIMSNEMAICNCIIDLSEIEDAGRGLFAGREFSKGNLF
jgi:hypothetical protein